MSDFIKRIGSKNLIKLGIFTIIIIICLIGFSLIYYNFLYTKSYEEIETIMVDAAKSYYSKNKDELPKTIGESTELKVSKLVSGEYMKSIQEYTKNEDIACKAIINVTNVNNNYRYNPLLDCGKYHSYELLVDKIKKEKIVTEGAGLYQIDEDLVYRGEKTNNYVKFAGKEWRITRISQDKLYLVYNDELDSSQDKTQWDNRYNIKKKSNVGINDYNVSRIKEKLISLYKKTRLFNNNNKLLLSNFSINIGKVGENEDDRKGTLAKSSTISNQYIGLLSGHDFMIASLDKNCNIINTPACSNYNYLANYDYSFWTITANKNTTHQVYAYYPAQGLTEVRASSNYYIRPVISIVKDAVYVSGNGFENNPYQFK